MRSQRRLVRPLSAVNLEPNTFIGGVAAEIPTKAALATKLEIAEGNISNFTIVGNDIECTISNDYSLTTENFRNNAIITYYKDFGGKLIIMGGSIFRDCSKFKVGYFKACTLFSSSTGNNSIFRGTSNLRLYVPLEVSTQNAGSPNPDMANASYVGYIENYTSPNAITNLSIGTKYATALQLNFTPPSSLNAIDFYECYANGVKKNNISASGGYITGLNPDTTYTITINAVDIYYNKSGFSNSVSDTTSATYVIPVSNIISYYKLEGNALDANSVNNGTPNAITYVNGLVGNGLSLNGTSSFVNLNTTNLVGGKSAFTITIPFKNLGKTTNNVLYGSWSEPNYKIIIWINGGKLEFYTYTTTTIGGAFFNFSDTANFHIAHAIYDGSVMKMELDGVESPNSYARTGAITTLGETERIGRFGSNYGNAIIDELLIWDVALNPVQRMEVNSKLLSGQYII